MSEDEQMPYSSQDGAEISKLAKINPQNLFKKGKGFYEDDKITQEDIKQKWKKLFDSGKLKTYLKAEANAALFNRAKQVVEETDSDSDYNPKEYVEEDVKKGGRGRPVGKKKTPSGIEKVLSSMASQFLPGNKPFLKAFQKIFKFVQEYCPVETTIPAF